MIVSEDSRQVPVCLNAPRPVLLTSRSYLILLRAQSRIRSGRRWRSLADVIGNLAAIAKGIQRGNDCLAVGTFPETHIEGNARRSFLRLIRPTDVWRRLPCRGKLLRRGTLDT